MPGLPGPFDVVFLDAEKELYEELFGLEPVFADERLCAFEIAAASVLLLFPRGKTLETVVMPGGTIPPHDGHGPLHVAFAIGADDLADWERRLEAQGVAIEGRTVWPRGGTSLYLRDPDGHLLELATPGLWPGH